MAFSEHYQKIKMKKHLLRLCYLAPFSLIELIRIVVDLAAAIFKLFCE